MASPAASRAQGVFLCEQGERNKTKQKEKNEKKKEDNESKRPPRTSNRKDGRPRQRAALADVLRPTRPRGCAGRAHILRRTFVHVPSWDQGAARTPVRTPRRPGDAGRDTGLAARTATQPKGGNARAAGRIRNTTCSPRRDVGPFLILGMGGCAWRWRSKASLRGTQMVCRRVCLL